MRRNILIIDDHDDLATALDTLFSDLGHDVTVLTSRDEAPAPADITAYDIVITDLDSRPVVVNGAAAPSGASLDVIKAFKVSAAGFRRDDFNEEELKDLVAIVLDHKLRYVDGQAAVRGLSESIEFELPSALSLMHVVLEYLTKRVEKLGLVDCNRSNLFVALDEAFVNAVKHGNQYDASKLIRVAAYVDKNEARFTIEDEGPGFDVNSIPDPLDPENLFKPSGRGVMFIYNIMDEVIYNERGNRLTMVKRCEPPA